MSEDEACRRIDVARLARRCPAMFPLLATGQLSLSVAALLKPHLSVENHVDLLAAVSGKSVQQAREVVAGRFPLPDVPSSLRKLPERRAASHMRPGTPAIAAQPPIMSSPSSAPAGMGSASAVYPRRR